MNKEYLKKAQPIVYQTLSNALKNKRVANAYLFHGSKDSSFSMRLQLSHS